MSDMKARWKSGFRGASIAEAEDVHKELKSIEARFGEIDPAQVVEKARSKRSKMHGLFTWDDAVAGERLRLMEARRVIHSIETFRPEAKDVGAVRAFQITRSQNPDNEGKNAYMAVDKIMEDPEARAELLKRALCELLAVRRRFHQLQELSIVFRELDKLMASVKP